MRIPRVATAMALGLVAGLAAAVVPAPGPAVPPPSIVVPSTQADEPTHPLRWLALGDSYSSGEGVDENYGDCAQSPGAYAAEAFHRLRSGGFPIAEQDFLACSGAEVPDAGDSVDLVEQMGQATGRYDLITLTIGGNDAGFGDALKRCITVIGCAPEAKLQSQIDAVRPTLFTAYGRLIDELLAPGGHIVVLGYPRIFEAFDAWHWSYITSCEWVDGYDADLIRRLSDRLNNLIADVAESYDNVHFLDVADAFERHNLCAGFGTTNEWLNGISVGWNSNRWPFRLMHSFHPNRTGHAAEAALLADYVKGLDWSGGSGGSGGSDGSGGAGCTQLELPDGTVEVQCGGIGAGELDITVEWDGRHHLNMFVDPTAPPGGHSSDNGSACLGSGGSKSQHWGPGEASAGTYEIWIQGNGLLKEDGPCDPGPYRLSVAVDGLVVWSIEDSVEPLKSKYYYVTLE